MGRLVKWFKQQTNGFHHQNMWTPGWRDARGRFIGSFILQMQRCFIPKIRTSYWFRTIYDSKTNDGLHYANKYPWGENGTSRFGKNMGVTQKIMKLVALLEPGFWATTKSNGKEPIVYANSGWAAFRFLSFWRFAWFLFGLRLCSPVPRLKQGSTTAP